MESTSGAVGRHNHRRRGSPAAVHRVDWRVPHGLYDVCTVLVLLCVFTENRWRCVRWWGRRLDGVVDLYTRESAWKLSGHTVGWAVYPQVCAHHKPTWWITWAVMGLVCLDIILAEPTRIWKRKFGRGRRERYPWLCFSYGWGVELVWILQSFIN
jgi:hypothetical protein